MSLTKKVRESLAEWMDELMRTAREFADPTVATPAKSM